MQNLLFSIIFAPFLLGLIAFILPREDKLARGFLVVLAVAVDFVLATLLFHKQALVSIPWAGLGMDFSLRLDIFSSFILLGAAFFSLLIVVYSLSFFKGRENSKQFYLYLLITLSFVNGAVLANNLILLLFFWEGLLLTLFGLIAIGHKGAFKTATKAFLITGFSDLCLLAGVALTGYLAKTLVISQISLEVGGLASLAFILLAIGAVSKAGAMPFHSWIPDAAVDAPLPFMAFLPASLEKLLGIYFLARVSLEMFKLVPGSWLSVFLMIVGGATIFLAVMMALVQKNYKKLLSYHAISQVGYMVLGIGTAIPAGIVGGLFHMLNHALYKSCLFLTAGSVEKQAGDTDLAKLGGLAGKMPLTFIAFTVAALSISGVPPFNGFFSKELVYHAALQRGLIFYIVAVGGAFLTAASFLKLGHAAFLGKARPEHKAVKEAPLAMLVPMGVLALTCFIFGVWNYLPLDNFIQPILGARLHGESFSGFSVDWLLVLITLGVLLAALVHHIFAVRSNGSALAASDHIHHAPGLSVIYGWAQKKYLDPYDVGLKIVSALSFCLFKIDRAVDWVYNYLAVRLAFGLSKAIRGLHSGYYAVYISWSLAGAVIVMLLIFK